MIMLIVPEIWSRGGVEFSQLAIPSVVLMLVAIALRTMLTYARGPNVARVKFAAAFVIAPLSVIFLMAMSLRISEALGQ
jgi:hypothetical protein